MQKEIVFAGFGGQGIMTMGTFLATAGMREGKNVTWLPSYGAEQRGGTANCTVVISENLIASPIVDHPGIVVIMNPPSLDKFEPRTATGGMLFVNSSLVAARVSRSDIQEFRIPVGDLAEELGDGKVANVIMLAAVLSKTELVEFDTLEDILREAAAKRGEKLMQLNLAAMNAGRHFKFS